MATSDRGLFDIERFDLDPDRPLFHGLAGEACHAWVDLLEPRAELADPEWNALPSPPTARVARGTPMRWWRPCYRWRS